MFSYFEISQLPSQRWNPYLKTQGGVIMCCLKGAISHLRGCGRWVQNNNKITAAGNRRSWEKTLLQCHYITHKSHTCHPWFWTDCLSHAQSHYSQFPMIIWTESTIHLAGKVCDGTVRGVGFSYGRDGARIIIRLTRIALQSVSFSTTTEPLMFSMYGRVKFSHISLFSAWWWMRNNSIRCYMT